MPRSVLMACTSCQITELRLRRTLHTWTTSVPGSAGVYLSLLATTATSNSSIKLVSACSTIRPDFQVEHQIIPLLLTRPARQEPCPFSDLQTPASIRWRIRRGLEQLSARIGRGRTADHPDGSIINLQQRNTTRTAVSGRIHPSESSRHCTGPAFASIHPSLDARFLLTYVN
jgi:hypothetical protein